MYKIHLEAELFCRSHLNTYVARATYTHAYVEFIKSYFNN